ncbi:MAG: uracil-DNA glycosylase [Myxococcota bacterium]|nr:uracil-DNA glycosylase [Myxococcota bacterium]
MPIPMPVQTSLLGAVAAPPASPGFRRGATSEPGGIEGGEGPPVVRGPCKPERRAGMLAEIDAEVRTCTKCALARSRTNTVFGVGDPCARVCFVGEGPGAEEDRRGEPFVGRAGQLLDKIVVAMGLRRGDVYIANTVKCRPPENRTPSPDEMKACCPYLARQIETVTPQVIVALGRPAVQVLLGTAASMSNVRGRFHRHRGVPVMPTYHPAYLLRNPAAKKQTWDDIRQVMRFLEEHPDPLKTAAG